MDIEDALICAWRVAGPQSEAIAVETLTDQLPEGPLWIHLNRDAPGLNQWLKDIAGIPPHTVAAMLQEDTRPRCEILPQGVMLNLRGINFNEGASPEDMLSLRVWSSPTLLITLRKRPLNTIQTIRDHLQAGNGPHSLGHLIVQLVAGLTDRVARRAEELGDELDELEDQVMSGRRGPLDSISQLRASVVRLRRFLAPQAVALGQLLEAESESLTEADRAFLRNAIDSTQRVIEELDALRERASILRDDISNELSAQMGRNMYAFTLLAGIFLPLGFITGLLGVNVAGIPGAQTSDAFWILCGILACLLTLEVWLLRRLNMWRA
ncbi:zinc transporter ZntB [Mangrovitalea sediminis]|uniref:zinc transporter ZntB n=1 Tax=Mangrovitalea sediminis TaxID=1982043 RepID=UPI000BE4F84E|nr:zinc transporter ZntB [Mangrovitalea sediminis]